LAFILFMNTTNIPLPSRQSSPAAEPAPSSAITLQAPLVGAEAARLALRCGERQLMAWVHSGDLEWAFDFRRDGARRACVRILTRSMTALLQRNRPITPREKAAQRLRPLQGEFDQMFQHHKPFLISTELARVWACSPEHVHNLIEDGLLGLAEQCSGACKAVQMARQSILQFMQTRRIL
jgi:hypothetical protein